MKILAVDDDMKVRETLSKMLSRLEYECIAAVSGEEALSILEENYIPIVISDIRMPGMNGLELLKEIKDKHQNIDVIIYNRVC